MRFILLILNEIAATVFVATNDINEIEVEIEVDFLNLEFQISNLFRAFLWLTKFNGQALS